ncbi:hypothetical protein [Actinoplanes palleronii]|uniref:hypothetical protein n=1 Tax=Actinoplanes palleronii TaxID=113570 RepID=UPI001944D3A5|nr:hypothetical protein [Actinoplanes palleronii]
MTRAVLAVLARLLPPGFRQRQRAEWAADLAELAPAGPATRWRYLLAAAWTLPRLRSALRPAGLPRWSPPGPRALLGRPGDRGIVVVAVLVSLLSGLFGAAFAVQAGLSLLSAGTTGFTGDGATPPGLGWVVASGAGLGAVIGWLLVGWAGRRAGVGSPAAYLAGAVLWPALLFAHTMLVFTLAGLPFEDVGVGYPDLLWLLDSRLWWLAAAAVGALAVVAVGGRAGSANRRTK